MSGIGELRSNAVSIVYWCGLVCIGAVGCSDSECTEATCVDAMTVNVEAATGAFLNGAYAISANAGNGVTQCTIVFGEDGVQDSCGAGFFITETRAMFSLTFPGTPDSVVFSVARGDSLLGDTVFVPVYDEIAPNGRECGPICLVATGDLVIPGR